MTSISGTFLSLIVLPFNIGLDGFRRHLTSGCHKIGWCPEGCAIVTMVLQLRAPVEQLSGGLSLEYLYHFAGRGGRRHGNEEMDMVRHNLYRKYRPAPFFGNGMQNLRQGLPVGSQNGLAVFRYPHYVQVQRISGMSRFRYLIHRSIIPHIYSMRKSFLQIMEGKNEQKRGEIRYSLSSPGSKPEVFPLILISAWVLSVCVCDEYLIY